MKTNYILLFLCLFVYSYGQNDYKQVYDKSLENQIKSSFGANREWQFSPGWYYNFLHSQYKSGENEKNNKIILDSLNQAATVSLQNVLSAHESITVVYENEKKHFEDRTSDREIMQIINDIEDAKESIMVLTGEFTAHKVPVNEAEKVYKEYERINNKYYLIGDTILTHLDNQKKRRAYSVCLDEFVLLINVCYRINTYCLVASKVDEFDEVFTKK